MADYKTRGVCSRSISFLVSEDGMLHNVSFEGGCHGNLQGICKLAEGRPVSEVIDRLAGIRCEKKTTSCPDQLATVLREYLSNQDKIRQTGQKQ